LPLSPSIFSLPMSNCSRRSDIIFCNKIKTASIVLSCRTPRSLRVCVTRRLIRLQNESEPEEEFETKRAPRPAQSAAASRPSAPAQHRPAPQQSAPAQPGGGQSASNGPQQVAAAPPIHRPGETPPPRFIITHTGESNRMYSAENGDGGVEAG